MFMLYKDNAYLFILSAQPQISLPLLTSDHLDLKIANIFKVKSPDK